MPFQFSLHVIYVRLSRFSFCASSKLRLSLDKFHAVFCPVTRPCYNSRVRLQNENRLTYRVQQNPIAIDNPLFSSCFRRVSHPVRCDAGVRRVAAILHGIGAGTVSPVRMSHRLEEDLSGAQGYVLSFIHYRRQHSDQRRATRKKGVVKGCARNALWADVGVHDETIRSTNCRHRFSGGTFGGDGCACNTVYFRAGKINRWKRADDGIDCGEGGGRRKDSERIAENVWDDTISPRYFLLRW